MKSQPIPRPASVTHLHLLAAVISEVRGKSALRIVDAGCGDGRLITYFRSVIPHLLPKCAVEVRGFDVSDRTSHGGGKQPIGTETVKLGEPWPYADSSADVIVSNQVLEHVFDLDFFCREIARCLKSDGVSIHLFPLKNVIYEDHVGIPLAHRIRNKSWIRWMARVGFYNSFRAKALPNEANRDFPECAVEYLNKYTNYVSRSEIKRIAANAGLEASFLYTPRIYSAKLRTITNSPVLYSYPKSTRLDTILSWITSYVAGITLVLRHPAGST
jgi:SAM-dependent methyltransferase